MEQIYTRFLKVPLAQGNIKLFIFSFLFCCFGSNLYAQQAKVIDDKIYKESIRTVVFYRGNVSNVQPMMMLNSNENMVLHFDDLEGGNRNYRYTLILCDMYWKPVPMLQSEYISGMFQDIITNYRFSSGTYSNYTHYEFKIPSDNMRPKLSGNYIVKVFLENEDNVIFTKRMYVYEPLVDIQGEVHQATYARYRDTKQEVDFNITTKNLTVNDPFRDIKVVLRQNGRWDNQIFDLKPAFMRDRMLVYNYEEGNLFDGGNEFRRLDLRDLRFKSISVKFYTVDSLVNATLFTDDDRSYNTYTFLTDANGNFVVHTSQGRDPGTEADYVKVNFSFRPTYRDEERDIYVYGALSNWQIDEDFKMKYNPREKVYETTALIKQGLYDYQYVTVDKDGKADFTALEGNHWETENNYMILVYYRPMHLPIDQLVGVQPLNNTIR